jgi:hypothetical protein
MAGFQSAPGGRFWAPADTTSRLLSVVKALSAIKQWKLAALRCDDLADFTSQLAHVWPTPDDKWLTVTKQLRDWAHVFQQVRPGHALPSTANVSYWVGLCNFIQTRIDKDSDYDPFT